MKTTTQAIRMVVLISLLVGMSTLWTGEGRAQGPDIIILNQIFLTQRSTDVATIQKFLDQRNSPLAKYETVVLRQKNTGAEVMVIGSVNEDRNINAELLLTYLQWQYKLLDSSNMTSAEIDALVNITPNAKHTLVHQLTWLAEQFWLEFEPHQQKPTAATDAVKTVLTRITGDTNSLDSFVKVYTDLFGQNPNRRGRVPRTDWSPVFRKPFDGFYAINSFRDHDNVKNSMTRLDGRTLSPTDNGIGYNWYDGHNAIDYDTGYNSVVAAGSGTIASAGPSLDKCPDDGVSRQANAVIINHPNGFQTKYWHLSSIAVNPRTNQMWKSGESINEGELIGDSGDTGCANGPHLHFGITEISNGYDRDPYGFWDSSAMQQPLFKSSLIVNEGSDGFERFYHNNWLDGTGDGGHAYYTLTGGANYQNWAIWWADIPKTGSYELKTFISNEAQATGVTYKVMSRDGIANVSRNQVDYRNQWMSLGTYQFDAHGWAGVMLTDYSTGATGQKIFFDAVEWKPVSVASPPTTVATLIGTQGNGTWYRSNVSVNLTTTDNGGGAKNTQYKIDNGGWQTGTSFTVSGDGNHTIYYKSQDNAGNWEADKSTTFGIDTVAPTGSLVINNNSLETYSTLVSLTSSVTDTTSGVTQMRLGYFIPGGRDQFGMFILSSIVWGDYQPYNSSITWQLPIPYTTICIQLKDQAGNENPSNTRFSICDSITLNLYPTSPSSTNYKIAKSTFGAAGQQGIQSVSYRLNGTLGQPSMVSLVNSANYQLQQGYWGNITNTITLPPISTPLTLGLDHNNLIPLSNTPIWITAVITNITPTNGVSGLAFNLSSSNIAIFKPACDKFPRIVVDGVVPPNPIYDGTCTNTGWNYFMTSEVITRSGRVVQLPFYAVSKGQVTLAITPSQVSNKQGQLLEHVTLTSSLQVVNGSSFHGLISCQYVTCKWGKRAILKDSLGNFITRTDTISSYEFIGLAPGTYLLNYRTLSQPYRFLPATRTVTITTNQTLTMNVKLWVGEIDGDSDIDKMDWYVVKAAIFPVSDPVFDLNGDGQTTIGDLVLLYGNIGVANPYIDATESLNRRVLNLNNDLSSPSITTLSLQTKGVDLLSVNIEQVKQPIASIGLQLTVSGTVTSVIPQDKLVNGFLNWHQQDDKLYIIAAMPENNHLTESSEILHIQLAGEAKIETFNLVLASEFPKQNTFLPVIMK